LLREKEHPAPIESKAATMTGPVRNGESVEDRQSLVN
jgi:hypothetical protein